MSGETKQRISELEAEIARLKEAQPTLRDQIAMAALPLSWKHQKNLEATEGSGEVTSDNEDYFFEQVSTCAYQIADVMMEARKNNVDGD